MTKRLLPLLATLVLLAGPGLAGDCLSGGDCANGCPLAKSANTRLATGTEAVTVSKTLHKEFVRTVLANLDAI